DSMSAVSSIWALTESPIPPGQSRRSSTAVTLSLLVHDGLGYRCPGIAKRRPLGATTVGGKRTYERLAASKVPLRGDTNAGRERTIGARQSAAVALLKQFADRAVQSESETNHCADRPYLR